MKKYPFTVLLLISSIIFVIYGSFLKLSKIKTMDSRADFSDELFGEESMAIAYAVHDVEERFKNKDGSFTVLAESDLQSPFHDTANAEFGFDEYGNKDSISEENTNHGTGVSPIDSAKKEDEHEVTVDSGSGLGTRDGDEKNSNGNDEAPKENSRESEGAFDKRSLEADSGLFGEEESDNHGEASSKKDGASTGETSEGTPENTSEEAPSEEAPSEVQEGTPEETSEDASENEGRESILSPFDSSESGGYGSFMETDIDYLTSGDTLLIGDSRQQGFGLYSGIKGMTVYADKGYAIYSVFNKAFINLGPPFGKVTLPQALSLEPDKYKKIYVMFGLNEMGWGNEELVREAYLKLVDMLKLYQPNAVIYLESILPVSERKANSSKYFRIERIVERNEIIKAVAREEYVAYLDLYSVYCNEDGYLPKEYAADGVHLKSAYFPIWTEFLLTHAL